MNPSIRTAKSFKNKTTAKIWQHPLWQGHGIIALICCPWAAKW